MSSIDNSSDFDGGIVASGKRGVIQLSDGNFNLTSNKDLKSDPVTGTVTTTGLTTTGTVFAATVSTSNLVADTITNLIVVGDATITGNAIVDGTISSAGLTSSENITITGAGNYLSSSGVTASNINATSNLYVTGPADVTGTLSALSMTTPRLSVSDHVLITGNLSVTGGFVTITSTSTESFALNVQNAGTGPAIVANQTGLQPVVDFQDEGNSVFFISGGEGVHPAAYVGIGTTTPTKKLDVVGEIRGTNLTATGNLDSSNVNTSNLYVSGPVDITGTLSSANVNTSNLYLSGPANITGTLSASNIQTSNLTVTNLNTVTNDAFIGGTLSASNIQSSNLTVTNLNTVTNDAFIGGTLSASNIQTSNLTVTNLNTVTNDAFIGGTLSASNIQSSNLTVTNLNTVTNDAFIGGTLSASNIQTSNLTVTNLNTVTNDAFIGGTLSASNIQSSNLTVTNLNTVTNDAFIGGTLSASNIQTSNLTVTNLNTVTNDAFIGGTLSASNIQSSNLTITNLNTVTNDAFIGGTLSASNIQTSNLTVTNLNTVTNDAFIGGTLSASNIQSSNLTITNLNTVTNDAFIGGTLSASNIQTSNLTVTNSHEVLGTLSASNIQTSNLTVTNLNTVTNDAFIGGTLSASNIQSSNLTITNLNTVTNDAFIGGTLSASNIQTSNLTVTNSHEVLGTLSASNIQTSNLTVTNLNTVTNDAFIGGTLSASNIQSSNLTITNLNTVTNDAFVGGTLSASNIQTSNLTITNLNTVTNDAFIGGTLSASNIQTSNLTVTNLNTVTNDAFIGGTLSASNIQTSNLTITNLNTVTNDAFIGGTLSASKIDSSGTITASDSFIHDIGSTNPSDFLALTTPGFTTANYVYTRAIVNEQQRNLTPAAIVFGNNNVYASNKISLVTNGNTMLYVDNSNVTVPNSNVSNLASIQLISSEIPTDDCLQVYNTNGALRANIQYNGDATFRTITVSNIQGGSPLTISASEGVTITSDVVVNNGGSFTVGTLVYETLTSIPGQMANLEANIITSSNINVTANLYVNGLATIDGTLTASLLLGDGGLLSNTAAQPNLQGVTDQGAVTTATIDVGGLTTSGTITTSNLVGSSFLTVTANTNVVAEFTESSRYYHVKEPRSAMTANSSFGYTASSSSEYSGNYPSFEAFNGNYKTDNGDSWISYNFSYVNTTGLPTDGTDSFQGTNGSWLKIQLQNTFKVQYVKIYPRNDGFPKKGKIYGSTDDSNWTQIYDFDDLLVATNDPVTLIVNSSNFYSYFVFHVEETGLWGTNTAYADWVAIQELEYYGTPYTAATSDGTDVIFKSVPNTPKTDFLDVYYDANDYTTMPATITNNNGGGSSGTPTDVTFNSTEPKSFEFNGTTGNVTGTHGLGTGNVPHSHSVWFKRTSAINVWDYVCAIGTFTNDQQSAIVINSNQINWSIYATNIRASPIIENDIWYHAVISYNGQNSTTEIYINGLIQNVTSEGAAGTLNLTGTTLKIGCRPNDGDYFNGSIANYRLYDRALSADEVWELYGYQKAYFSVSPDVVTYKAGRIGIGTSEPRAVLDVVGDVKINGELAVGKDTIITSYIGKVAIGYNNGDNNAAVFAHHDQMSDTNYALKQSAGGTVHLNRPNTYDLKFKENNTEQMVIASGGNVGIGTISPQQKLEVHGNMLLGQNDADSFIHGGASIAITSDAHILIVADSNDTTGIGASDIIFGYGSAIDTNVNRNFTYAEAFPTGLPRVETMRIDSTNDRVGIGITNPSQKLHVAGNVSATDFIGGGAAITAINATNISTGTIDNARLPTTISRTTLSGSTLVKGATLSATTAFNGNGAGITAINATNISTGTIDNARLPTTISRTTLSGSTLVQGLNATFSGNLNAGNTTLGTLNATTGTFTGVLNANGGSKIVIQNQQNGGVGRGLYIWTVDDTNWVIYMSQPGGGRSASGGTAVAGSGISSYAMRFRVYNNSANGFVWENSSEQLLMSLRGSDGYLYVSGLLGGTTFQFYSSMVYSYAPNYSYTDMSYDDWAQLRIYYTGNSRDAFVFRMNDGYAEAGSIRRWTNTRTTKWRGYMEFMNGYGNTSDRRIKEDIQDLSDEESLDIIIKLKPKTFHWRDKQSPGDLEYGFIAQDIEDVFPSMVVRNPGEIKLNKYIDFEKISDTEISIILDEKDADCTVGDILSFRIGDNEDDYKELNFTVISKTGNNVTLKTDKTIEQNDSEQIFYTGRKVEDQLSIKGSYLDPLMISAIQQLERRLSASEAELQAEKQKMASLLARIEALENSS